MDVSPVFFLEFGLFGGAAIGWGLWQLWWLRRDRLQGEAAEQARKIEEVQARKIEEEQAQKNTKQESEQPPGHAEGQ